MGMLGATIRIFAQTVDSDGDGMADNYELFFGLNPTSSVDAALDPDLDSNSNLGESVPWSDPFTMDTDRDGWIDGQFDSSPLSRAVMLWGTPKYTVGTNYDYTGPSWWIGGERTGGSWLTNAWYCPATGSIIGTELRIPLNRAQLTNSLVMGVTYFDHPGGQLHVDLIQSNGLTTAMDLFGNLISGSSSIVSRTYVVPVTNSPQTAKIQLRHAWGAVTIYSTMLYIDRDLDGLDDAQELQAGTDPLYTNGIQAYLPGRIEAENYGPGGDGRGYHDVDAINSGGAYRPTDGADIELTTDIGGGYNVGWTRQGEWLAYTVLTTNEGFYALRARLAQTESNSICHVEVDGRDVSGQIRIPNTGGAQVWQNVPAGAVYLAKGLHVIRLKFDAGSASGGNGNVNYIDMTTLGLATTVLQKGVSPGTNFIGCKDSTFRSFSGYSFGMQALGRDESIEPRWKDIEGTGILWFDLASIPSSGVVQRATLRMWFEPSEFDTNPGKMLLYPLGDPNGTGMWGENNGAVVADYDTSGTTGSANYKRSNITWTASGDGKYYNVVNTSEVRRFTHAPRQAEWITFDVTAEISKYVTNAAQNMGWVFSAESDETIRGSIYTSDSATPSKRPSLEIVYGLAAPGGVVSNQAPVVIAGSNQTITLPSAANLSGTATDDGLPSNKLTVAWSKVSGAGTVAFGNATSLVTTASFSTNGSYVLRLIASDTALTRTGTVTIAVNAAPVNQAPVVSAGTSQTITLPSTATLSGTATDDGLPSGTLTLAWGKVSGPGTVTFTNAATANTRASFSTNGSYVLQLTANDSALIRTGTVTITVNAAPPVNQAPVVSAGTNQAITLPSAVNLSGTATDDGLPSNKLTVAWSKLVGAGTVTFGNATSLVTTANFSTNGSYVLQLIANDTALIRTGTVTITVNAAPPVNQAPVVSAGANQAITLPSAVNLSGTATDDGLPSNKLTVAWSKMVGAGTVTFGNATSLVTTASFSTNGSYVLQLIANDTALIRTGTVTITVNASPSAPSGVVTARLQKGVSPGTNFAGCVDSTFRSIYGASFGQHALGKDPSLDPRWKDTEGTGIVRFDLSSIPAGATIQSATLKLWHDPSEFEDTAGALLMYPLHDPSGTGMWEENTASDPSQYGTVAVAGCALFKKPGVAWAATGEGRYSEVISTGEVIRVTHAAGVTGWLSFAVTRDVKVYATNAAQNLGWIFYAEADGTVRGQLHTADSSTAAKRPMLEVVYGSVATNQAPVVSAGTSQTITLPSTATLSGTATDDGLPSGTLTLAWGKVSGPGTVTFTNAATANTRASFSTNGSYVLKLTANDSALIRTGTVTITVNAAPPVNQAPVVNAGSNQTVFTPGSANLSASVTDDGLPSNKVTVTWSQGSGPGVVTFGNVTSLVTTASFTTAGTYVLRLTASDGLRLSTGTVSIAVSNMALSTTGLLAKWSFEQATWTGAVGEVRDSSTFSNHGRAFSGAIPVSNGVVGKAAWFDGTNDYIEIPSTSNLQVNGSMALMFWIKPLNIGAQRLNPIDKSYGGEFALTIETNGRLSYFHGTAQATSNYWTYTALPSGRVVNALWQHVAIVRDAASTNVRCYYNGILVSQAVYSVAANQQPTKTTNAIRIARGYTAQSVLGSMDEVCIYSRALSASEVYGAYLATRPPNQAPYVNAGADKTVTLPAAASLVGIAADDGLPSNRLVVTWSKVSGTGTVTFANATSLVTTATMSTSGVYVLQLVASDGTLASTDAVQVTVSIAPTNVAPTITSFTVTSASNFHNEGSVLMQASAIDSNGNAVSYQYTVQGSVVSAWSTNRTATWQPGLTNTGLRTFGVYARDPFGLTNSVIRTNFIFRTPPRP